MTPAEALTATIGLTLMYVEAILISTLIIRRGIVHLDPSRKLPDSSSEAIFDLRATGFWIGICETVLIFVLVCAGEYSALAIIVGAKEFVRKEKIQSNPSYYLLGTLANLTVAVLLAGLGCILFLPQGL